MEVYDLVQHSGVTAYIPAPYIFMHINVNLILHNSWNFYAELHHLSIFYTSAGARTLAVASFMVLKDSQEAILCHVNLISASISLMKVFTSPSFSYIDHTLI